MKVSTRIMAGVAAVCLGLAMAGCETYGQAGGLGAALGGATGAVIGHQSGHALEGAAIGAAVGGITGLIAHDIKAKRAKSREETAQAYNYQAQQGELLRFERTEVLPPRARPGEMVESSIQYALLGTGGGAQATEQRTLIRGDQVIADLSTQTFNRGDGTWVSAQEFRLPSNLQPGQYTIMTAVRTAQSAISGRAGFVVE